MEYANIHARLHAHIARLAGPNVRVEDDMDLVTQLGLDSIKVLDLVMEIEDEFDISIPMNVLADVRNLRDLAQAIHRLVSG
jgi:acyl carrier protein